MRVVAALTLSAWFAIAGSIGGQTVQACRRLWGPRWTACILPGESALLEDDVRTAVGARLGATPNVVVGDFDGNGRPDVAVLIEYRNTDEPLKAFTHYIEIIAFLNTAQGYEPIRLQERSPGPDSARYLTLQKRGEQGFDFEAERKFVYPHDSIGVWLFGKAVGGTYIYENGKFRYIREAD